MPDRCAGCKTDSGTQHRALGELVHRRESIAEAGHDEGRWSYDVVQGATALAGMLDADASDEEWIDRLDGVEAALRALDDPPSGVVLVKK